MAKPPENLAMNVVPNLLYRNNIQYPVVIADSGFLSENSWHKKHKKKKRLVVACSSHMFKGRHSWIFSGVKASSRYEWLLLGCWMTAIAAMMIQPTLGTNGRLITIALT